MLLRRLHLHCFLCFLLFTVLFFFFFVIACLNLIINLLGDHLGWCTFRADEFYCMELINQRQHRLFQNRHMFWILLNSAEGLTHHICAAPASRGCDLQEGSPIISSSLWFSDVFLLLYKSFSVKSYIFISHGN